MLRHPNHADAVGTRNFKKINAFFFFRIQTKPMHDDQVALFFKYAVARLVSFVWLSCCFLNQSTCRDKYRTAHETDTCRMVPLVLTASRRFHLQNNNQTQLWITEVWIAVLICGLVAVQFFYQPCTLQHLLSPPPPNQHPFRNPTLTTEFSPPLLTQTRCALLQFINLCFFTTPPRLLYPATSRSNSLFARSRRHLKHRNHLLLLP